MTVKELKNALLQEAVQGKLVPQIASEGNARDLLEEIRNEKLSHGLDFANAKSGKRKSKKETALAGSNPCDITEEEIPFDIPESWCWCRLGELGKFVRGSGIKRDETTNTGLPCVRYGEMYTNYKIKFSKTKSFTSKDVFEKCHKIHTNDILMALTGENKWDIALAATYEGTEEIAMGGDLCKFTPINCNSLFLVYLINSPYGIEYKRNTSTGDIIVHTSTTKLGNLLIPLPPLAEQKRIVVAIEKFMPLIEEYGKKETQLKAINEKIGTLTKKAILQEAVQGKLVPQIAAEGNAKDLLEEIRNSHTDLQIPTESAGNKKSDLRSKSQIRVIKKSNVLPEITEDEIPFDIPENWCWCRLGEIGDWKAGSTPSRSNPELYNGNIPWLKTGDLTDGDINEIPECISEKALESCSMRLNPIGSVLIAMYGATIGKLGILKIEATTNQACCACVPYNGIYNKYLFYYLMSQKKDFTEKAEGGAQPNISREKLVVHLLPLPPLSEQKRVVAAIEKILPLCEKLGE